ncbi:MAG: hypothetical protein KJ548_08330 [Actinobacteria bacterium]|nr:hypothetical protein [Actinomycetota bacterium]MCG2798032.1 hypothetical protein [Cellulomonas sp.]
MAERPTPMFQVYRLAGTSGMWWRVVSPNGRALGRSASELPDAAAVHAHLDRVIAEREQLEPTVRVTPSHRWRWQLALDGEIVVHGSAEQDRRVRCDAAWRAFVQIAGQAQVDPVVHVFHRGYAPSSLAPTSR